MNKVDLLKQLISIPSESGKEDKIVNFLNEIFLSFDWKPKTVGNNLYTIIGNSGPVLLLNSHLDTVPAGNGWSIDPLGGTEKNDIIYGRGANDAKGSLCAMILGAKSAFDKGYIKGQVCIAASCEEELMVGNGLELLLPELPKIDAAVIGEPTGLNPAIAQKGLIVLEIEEVGHSAHAAWGGGINAINKAARDILSLNSLALNREHPFLGKLSIEVTQINGGICHNVIPDSCKLVVDIRLIPTYSVEEVIDIIKDVTLGEVTIGSNCFRSVETPRSHKIVKAAIESNIKGKPFGSPTLSDWVHLKNVPAVKVGPGDSKRSHTANEYIEKQEYLEGIEFYEQIIKNYFNQED